MNRYRATVRTRPRPGLRNALRRRWIAAQDYLRGNDVVEDFDEGAFAYGRGVLTDGTRGRLNRRGMPFVERIR